MKPEDCEIGAPVQKYYKHLRGYSPSVFFIRRINDEGLCEVAQEVHPSSHFSYCMPDRLKPSAFTKAKSSTLNTYIQEAILSDSVKPKGKWRGW
jgi:hypothetical protein